MIGEFKKALKSDWLFSFYCPYSHWLRKRCDLEQKIHVVRFVNKKMKVKNDPRSEFSNLSNWKEEA